MYLKEEIQAEAVVRNLPGFARFLPVAALFHGQTLNVASLGRDAEASRTTVSGYVQILEDTLVAFRLPAFQSRLRVREERHPKLYWVDAGIVRALKRRLGEVAREEQGSLFEGWVANLLRAYQSLWGLFDEWAYWSPADAKDTEVDFLLERGRGRERIAIETKASERMHEDMLKGLRAIEPLPGLRRRILVHRATRRLATKDGIEIWPVEHCSRALADGTL